MKRPRTDARKRCAVTSQPALAIPRMVWLPHCSIVRHRAERAGSHAMPPHEVPSVNHLLHNSCMKRPRFDVRKTYAGTSPPELAIPRMVWLPRSSIVRRHVGEAGSCHAMPPREAQSMKSLHNNCMKRQRTDTRKACVATSPPGLAIPRMVWLAIQAVHKGKLEGNSYPHIQKGDALIDRPCVRGGQLTSIAGSSRMPCSRSEQ